MDSNSLPENEFAELHGAGEPPQISCLMPIYRQEAFVEQAVSSVLNQRDTAVEILISDDCSGDDTLPMALATIERHLAAGSCQHRILVRRGTRRLKREHLPLLIENAGCDLVFQAHGDDLSHPQRAAVMVEIFAARPATSMLGVDFVPIDDQGRPREEAKPMTRPIPVAPYHAETLISCPPELIGAVQGWRKSAVAPFGALTTQDSPVSHDRILPFRAALVGDVCSIRLQLVMRRMHADMWGNDMKDGSSAEANRFGWTLARQAAYRVMRGDLETAQQNGWLDSEKVGRLSERLEASIAQQAEDMLVLYRDLYNSGKRLAWIAPADEETG